MLEELKKIILDPAILKQVLPLFLDVASGKPLSEDERLAIQAEILNLEMP